MKPRDHGFDGVAARIAGELAIMAEAALPKKPPRFAAGEHEIDLQDDIAQDLPIADELEALYLALQDLVDAHRDAAGDDTAINAGLAHALEKLLLYEVSRIPGCRLRKVEQIENWLVFQVIREGST